MISLVMLDDDQFLWCDNTETSQLMNKFEAIVYGFWKYAITKSETKFAMYHMNDLDNCVFFEHGIISDIGSYKGIDKVQK